MPNFMIQYVNRFKDRYEKEIDKLGRYPLENPILQELQLTRARRALNAANVIVAMGPNAFEIDHKKFENWRAILLLSNETYNITRRRISSGGLQETCITCRRAPQQSQPKSMYK